jgi:hypothetical protein
MKTKVFCIGFHKTGTTSLAVALRAMDYKVSGPDGVNDPEIEQNVLPMAYSLVPQFDAFLDNPWPIIFKELDAKYPGSKFILTVRNTDSWIKSLVRHFGSQITPMRNWIYDVGCPVGNENIYIKRYEDHNEEVLHYFKDRPLDLLTMELNGGDGWEQICSFLGKKIPKVPFPHANKALTREKYKILTFCKNKAKSLVNRII